MTELIMCQVHRNVGSFTWEVEESAPLFPDTELGSEPRVFPYTKTEIMETR